METRLVWFRRDLRVDDHPALTAACAGGADREGLRVLPLFVLDPRLVRGRTMSPPRLSYLCDALADLDAALRARGSRLVLRSGDARAVVPAVAREVGAAAVHWSGDVTPFAAERDRAVAEALGGQGVAASPHPGILVHQPGTVVTAAGVPYKVYSPFRREWERQPVGDPLPAPVALPPVPALASDDLPTTGSLGVADRVPAGLIQGGERAAHDRLERFLAVAAARYGDRRDLLGEAGTSRLSADLHYGCVAPRAAYRRLDRTLPGHDAFARELVWRDFYGHVMATWPAARTEEFNPAFRGLPWRRESEDFAAWCAGATGYPIVDAGMRQMLAEGWMHNRARMLTASFLCKDLLTDWRLGDAYFLSHLVDGDVASNNGGWQWAAGTGTDAQPYFRIFNPVTQGEKFDPAGVYVRRYVPELAGVPDRWVHHPWDMPPAVARAAGVEIGRDYPAPIIDHAQARARALAWFAQHRRD